MSPHGLKAWLDRSMLKLRSLAVGGNNSALCPSVQPTGRNASAPARAGCYFTSPGRLFLDGNLPSRNLVGRPSSRFRHDLSSSFSMLLSWVTLFALALVVAVAIKVVGVLLIAALLIIPAAAARTFSRTPEVMALLAAVTGALAIIGGLQAAYWLDTPTGPTIVSLATILFMLSGFVGLTRRRLSRGMSPSSRGSG